jgi:tetratricopeptide (TPR) repeat protein
MKRVMEWMVAEASLSFAVPISGGQNDPRLPALFRALKSAATPDEAAPVEAKIWAVWTVSGDQAVDSLMAVGLAAVRAQRYREGLAVFDRIVRQLPDFAEGWNKRATVHYLLGSLAESTEDARRALALEPRHFGAMSGLGLIALAEGDEPAALEWLEAALAIHPHLPGAGGRARALRQRWKARRM